MDGLDRETMKEWTDTFQDNKKKRSATGIAKRFKHSIGSKSN